jgi:hypothetical protein
MTIKKKQKNKKTFSSSSLFERKYKTYYFKYPTTYPLTNKALLSHLLTVTLWRRYMSQRR